MNKVQKVIKRFRDIPHKDHKPLVVIAWEIMAWVISERGGINIYLDYELYLRDRKPGDYLKLREFKRIEKELNSPEYFPILEDKYFFARVLEGNCHQAPENLYLVDPNGIYNLKLKTYINEADFLSEEFEGFCKLNNGFGGKKIYRIGVSEGKVRLNGEEIRVSDFLQFLGEDKFLIQRLISQHEDMNRLNPSCVNTLRIVTLRAGRDIHLYQVYLRIGINDNYVDNGLSGNMMAGVYPETGKLHEHAYFLYNDLKYDTTISHPQTNTVFKDFQIPYFRESVQLALSLHQLYHQFFMVGWDIGITPEGPIVIEGNNIATLYPMQFLYGGLKSSFTALADEFRKHR